jgi:hypothetical protein
MGAMQANIESLHKTIDAMVVRMDEIITENKALKSQSVLSTLLNSQEVIKKGPKKAPFSTGRGGWRVKAAQISDKTLPAPADSMKRLAEKVKREGGAI